MNTFASVSFAILIGLIAPAVRNASAETKKKATDKSDSTQPVAVNETWSPKTNRQPAPSDTPVTTEAPVRKEKPGAKRTPAPAKTVALGDKLKSKVVSNPQPPLPDAAKKAKVSGPVRVEVTVDEKGNVVSAKAVSGNPLLHAEAVKSAKKARFSPTLLSGQPVKVSGVITYNFVLQ